MTLRGTFREGVIIPDQLDGLRNGDIVEIRKRAAASTPKPKKTRKSAQRIKAGDPLPGFGIWKGRRDWTGKSSVEVARELRRKALGR